MSEIHLKHVNALIVSEIEPQSPAARAGVVQGDLLRRINDRPVVDILDYRFHAADSRLMLEIEREGQTLLLPLRKPAGADTGLSFEFDLGDRIHTCKNKCVFCFIHQMPRKMRKSLYLMDDDFRLSFMHGNYVTLTNLSDEEWARILEQRLSPLYVSVHATDPEVRRVMLGRKEPTPILPQIRELAANRIDVHAQIVLCPGWNDGEHLDQTLEELAREHPTQTGLRAGVQSVAIVPVGMTRFRERLPELAHVEQTYARDMVRHIESVAARFKPRLGTRFSWMADEWYFLAGLPFPGKAHYEEFPQLEDGIGTVRLFLEDARRISSRLPLEAPQPVSATLVTAEMPAPIVREFAARLNEIAGVQVNVCVVKNQFFGGDIRIAGLLTAADTVSHLREFTELHPLIYLPSVCLRDGVLFLDDVTLDEVRTESGLDIRVTGTKPSDLARALGLLRSAGSTGPARGWIMEESVVA